MQARPSFEDAVSDFRSWLRESGWSDELLWLTADRITGYKRTFWIRDVKEMGSDLTTRRFYEDVAQTDASVRIDAFCRVGEKTIAYVENYGGDGRLLNYGIPKGHRTVHQVKSWIVWELIGFLNRFRGESPFVVETDIPKRA